MQARSLTQRLTAAMWLLAAISCSIAAGLSTSLILRNSEHFATQNLKAAEANLISLGILDLITNGSDLELDPLIPKTVDSAQLSEIVRIYDSHGRIIYANINTRDLSTSLRQLSRHVDQGIFVIPGASHEYYTLIRSYRSPSGRIFWLQIATPRPVVNQVLRGNAIPFALMFLTLLFFSFFVARLVAIQSLSPLRKIMHHIDSLDSDRIKTWHPLALNQMPSDFRPFAEKINQLILRSQRSLLKFHQIGRYIAHEVRTPLTIIQGEIETSLMQGLENSEKTRGLLESALQEVSRIEQIVHTVLRLAARDRGTDPYKPELFKLSKFVREVWSEFERTTGRESFLIDQRQEDVEVFMDRELLSLLLSNFARNISRHTPSDTSVRVRIEQLPSSEAVLSIQDSGGGMPLELLEEANDIHAVGRKLGLGLSLCKEICGISKIQLQFSHPPEGGLRVQLIFPRVPATFDKVIGRE